MLNFIRKYHKWAGIVLTLLLILFSISGIILNHRQLLAKYSISRKYMPKENRYEKWNNAAVKDMYKISADSIFVYGNIGVWKTDTTLTHFADFNKGFSEGIDNRKVFKIIEFDNTLFAGTLYGFYRFDKRNDEWKLVDIPVNEKNVVDMEVKDGVLYVLTRSFLLATKNGSTFEEIKLPAPLNYDNKIGLFKTLWVVHSGEIYGETGKIVVDVIALITIFLSVTGLILYFSQISIRKRKNEPKKRKKTKKRYNWNLKWHNKIGWTTTIFLLITTATGIFLRPPFLIAIAEAKVGKLPYTVLDTPNPWYDLLRRIMYVPSEKMFMLSTFEGFYYSKDNFATIEKFEKQPPGSVMGVTVLKQLDDKNFLIGSFDGLFEWNLQTGIAFDIIKNEEYIAPVKIGPPGDFKISGYGFDRKNQKIAFDYTFGVLQIGENEIDFPEMSQEILDKTPMSLWGAALEVHTGRYFKPITGKFYILIVPLVGIFGVFIIIAGFVIWFKYYRNKESKKKKRNLKMSN